jgi:hypothetical protein
MAREPSQVALFIRSAKPPREIPRTTAILGLKMLCLNTASEMRFKGKSEAEILVEVERLWARGGR